MSRAVASTQSERTRRRIIAAAERLFAEKGFKAMTLRDVTREARVNLAAVNYHFGSKRNLMRAVVQARFEPINAERLSRLEAAVAARQPDPVPLRTILEALLAPLFEAAQGPGGLDRTLMQMIGRSLSEPAPFLREIHRDFFSELCRRFEGELGRALPGLSADELHYRLFFTVSAMIGAVSERTRLETISGGEADPDAMHTLLDRLIAYCRAGMLQDEPPPAA